MYKVSGCGPAHTDILQGRDQQTLRPDTVERFHSYSMCKYTLCHMHNHCTMEPVIRTTCTQRPPVRYCTVHNIKSTITAKHLCIESLENTYS